MGWVMKANSRPLYIRERDQVHIIQEVGGPRVRSGRVWKQSRPPKFDPRTVSSFCTDRALMTVIFPLTTMHHKSYTWDRRAPTTQSKIFIYLVNKYI